MISRVKVGDLVQDIRKYCNDQSGSGEEVCDANKITQFVEEKINEPIPSFETFSMWTDVGLIHRLNTKQTLEEAKKRSKETVGLEEQGRYYQLYCQPPTGKKPIALPSEGEQAMVCSYFKNKFEKIFPTRHSSLVAPTSVPIVRSPEGVVDGDTDAFGFQDTSVSDKDFVCRLSGLEMQESWGTLIGVTEVPEDRIQETMQKGMNVVDKFCYDRAKEGRYCVVSFEGDSSKMFTQGKDGWRAMARIVKVANPDLAEKLNNKELINELKTVFETATQYRGLFGKEVHKGAVKYAQKHGAKELMEPSYAIPDLWDEDVSTDGRLQLVDLFGRILMWSVFDQENILVDFLKDEKEGISLLATKELKDLYGKSRQKAEEDWNKVDFGKYGISPDEEIVIKEMYLSSMVDPEKVYSPDNAVKMAADLEKRASKGEWNFKSCLNMFLIDIGAGTDINSSRYPELRSKVAWKVKKEAAVNRRGLFYSDVFFQTYAPTAERKKQLEVIRQTTPSPKASAR